MSSTPLQEYKIADFNKMKVAVTFRSKNRNLKPNWKEACPEVTPVEEYLNVEEISDRLVDRTLDVADVFIHAPQLNKLLSSESSDDSFNDFRSQEPAPRKTCPLYDMKRNVCQPSVCAYRSEDLEFDENTLKEADELELYTRLGRSASVVMKNIGIIERRETIDESITDISCVRYPSKESSVSKLKEENFHCLCVYQVPISEEETEIENSKDSINSKKLDNSKDSLIDIILNWSTIKKFSLKDTMRSIELYCHLWEKDPKWKFSVHHVKDINDYSGSVIHVVEVCFSIPTKTYPVPQVTVSVFFQIEVSQMLPPSMKIKVTYTFETQRYSYVPSNDISSQVIQLARILNHKINVYKRLTY